MLASYLSATANLLQSPAAPTSLYSTANLTTWINSARGQVAAEGACCRALCTQALTISSAGPSSFSTVTIPHASTVGLSSVLNVRSIWYSSGSGMLWVPQEPWESFSIYELNKAAPGSGTPMAWAQFSQGALGSIYVSPPPAAAYTMTLDCACLPISLGLDSDPEAIPYPWTDAVPYFAAYLALMSAQTTARANDAKRMIELYQVFMGRARNGATPGVLPWQSEQVQTPGGINAVAPQPQGGG